MVEFHGSHVVEFLPQHDERHILYERVTRNLLKSGVLPCLF
jgi:hypothetical protein